MKYKYTFIPNYYKNQKKTFPGLTQQQVEKLKQHVGKIQPRIVTIENVTEGAYAIQPLTKKHWRKK